MVDIQQVYSLKSFKAPRFSFPFLNSDMRTDNYECYCDVLLREFQELRNKIKNESPADIEPSSIDAMTYSSPATFADALAYCDDAILELKKAIKFLDQAKANHGFDQGGGTLFLGSKTIAVARALEAAKVTDNILHSEKFLSIYKAAIKKAEDTAGKNNLTSGI